MKVFWLLFGIIETLIVAAFLLFMTLNFGPWTYRLLWILVIASFLLGGGMITLIWRHHK